MFRESASIDAGPGEVEDVICRNGRHYAGRRYEREHRLAGLADRHHQTLAFMPSVELCRAHLFQHSS